MKNTKRKGFTIVELVIVIAVIAILAAVLIPTFASLINKANRSADIQAVHQMNTQLAIDEVDSNKTIVDVYAALEEGGMTAKDYNPLISDTYFFWDSELNRVLYTDSDYKVTYPEEYKDVTSNTKGHQWFSLNGKIKEEPVTPESDKTYKISTAGQLYWIANQVTDKKIPGGIKISLNSAKIDLMGANVKFHFEGKDNLIKSFELNGVTNGTEIVGLSQLSYNQTDVENNKIYGCGLLSTVDTGSGNGKVTLSNITIKDSVVGDLETGCVGALIGSVVGAATDVTIEKCKVEDTVVYGKNKVGGLIGQIGAGKVDIKECTLEDTTVNTSEGEGGIVVGCFYNTAELTIDKSFKQFADGCTLKLVDSKYDRESFEASSYATNFGDNSVVPAGTYFVEAKDQDGNYDNKYRMYVPGAYATVVYTKSDSGTLTFKVGTVSKISNAQYEYESNTKNTYNSKTCLLLYTAITE